MPVNFRAGPALGAAGRTRGAGREPTGMPGQTRGEGQSWGEDMDGTKQRGAKRDRAGQLSQIRKGGAAAPRGGSLFHTGI